MCFTYHHTPKANWKPKTPAKTVDIAGPGKKQVAVIAKNQNVIKVPGYLGHLQ